MFLHKNNFKPADKVGLFGKETAARHALSALKPDSPLSAGVSQSLLRTLGIKAMCQTKSWEGQGGESAIPHLDCSKCPTTPKLGSGLWLQMYPRCCLSRRLWGRAAFFLPAL